MSKIDEIALKFSDAVRDAFAKVYGPPRDPEYRKAVCPTWSENGIRVGWHDPDPGVVLIFSEYGWIADPYSHEGEERKAWEQVMGLMQEAGWDKTDFESINPAVHIVYWTPPDRWRDILNKRGPDRMNPKF